jgi:(R)-2-hydroxyacyl-CoA dehydratese activating ATPase
MLTAGLDIGSRTIAIVEWNGDKILRYEVIFTGIDPATNSRRLIGNQHYDRMVATGYGRYLATEQSLADSVITEIKAYAIGARHLYNDVRTILDIGGQDSKAISIGDNGTVSRFEMNDRCAAGTGRFLENMALALGMTVENLGLHALESHDQSVPLSSMCTVFAESEVVSLIGRGADSRRVAMGIHEAITDRVSAMVQRVGVRPRFVFAGGVACNPCMKYLLTKKLNIELTIPENPQIVGALGAAIQAQREIESSQGGSK